MPTDADLEDDWDKVQLISQELIDLLKSRFPANVPSPTSTEREDCYSSGTQCVIGALILGREYQIERARERGTHGISPQ